MKIRAAQWAGTHGYQVLGPVPAWAWVWNNGPARPVWTIPWKRESGTGYLAESGFCLLFNLLLILSGFLFLHSLFFFLLFRFPKFLTSLSPFFVLIFQLSIFPASLFSTLTFYFFLNNLTTNRLGLSFSSAGLGGPDNFLGLDRAATAGDCGPLPGTGWPG